MLFRQPSAQQ
uniref:Uncharacterized protein n=1 Tax=Arundo donax TaxID=35708 RepID=A0A0A9GU69_ARUDO